MNIRCKRVYADLHTHLRTGCIPKDWDFDKVIDAAYKRLGPGGILGLCNCKDNRYERFANLRTGSKGYARIDCGFAVYVPQKDIWIIKGQEVNTSEGEVLVLGLKAGNHIKEGLSLIETLYDAKFRSDDTISIIVHPFWKDGAGKGFDKLLNAVPKAELEKLVDGFEVFDANASFYVPFLIEKNANEKAITYYNRKIITAGLDIGAVMSSDNHSLRGIGKGYTTLWMFESFEGYDFITSLRDAIKMHKNLEGNMTDDWAGALRHAVASYGYYGPARVKNWLKERRELEERFAA